MILVEVARIKLKKLWDEQDGHAKKSEFPAATAKLQAALLAANTELAPLIKEQAKAAKQQLGAAELAVDRAKTELAATPVEQRAEKLTQIRKLVTGLFASRPMRPRISVSHRPVSRSPPAERPIERSNARKCTEDTSTGSELKAARLQICRR